MTRRRLLLFGLPAVFVAVGLAVWLLWPRPSSINRQNYDEIQAGMTLAEVEEILGGPARDESGSHLRVLGPWEQEEDGFPSDFQGGQVIRVATRAPNVWVSSDLIIRIDFDNGGRVAGKNCLRVERAEQSLLDKLRLWLGL